MRIVCHRPPRYRTPASVHVVRATLSALPAQVIHRVGLALLRISESRLLKCVDQQELLCSLQEEQANCLDCERLLSLAFDRLSFLRSFPRSRIEALRRRHRARLLAAEGARGDGGGTPIVCTVAAAPESEALAADESSDESDDDAPDAIGADDGGYEHVSLDDLSAPTRSFWL